MILAVVRANSCNGGGLPAGLESLGLESDRLIMLSTEGDPERYRPSGEGE